MVTFAFEEEAVSQPLYMVYNINGKRGLITNCRSERAGRGVYAIFFQISGITTILCFPRNEI